MAKLLHVSEAASLALHSCGLLAQLGGGTKNTRDLAAALNASAAHLAKVMARLDRAGFVSARRGPGGGYHLAKPPHKISLLQICEAIEGKFETAGCPFGMPVCDGQGMLSHQFQSVTEQLLKFLGETTLASWSVQLKTSGTPCRCHAHSKGEHDEQD